MGPNPQWDIPRALGVAKLFHLLCGAREACVTPFLTLYLRQLGLAAPWVGVLMGARHLTAACWAPFCAFLARRHRKRRVFLAGSLLGSAAAGLLMVLVPPVDRHLDNPSCPGGLTATATILPLGVTRTVTLTSTQEMAPNHPAGGPRLSASRHPRALETSGFPDGAGENRREIFSGLQGHLSGSVKGARTAAQALHPTTSRMKRSSQDRTLELGRASLGLLPRGAGLGAVTLPAAQGHAQALDLSWKGLRWTFLLCLGLMVFWELLAAPLERVADDSLYEYLDFVDFTDRYRGLGMWRSLGMSTGVCGIAALVGQLGCFLIASGPWGVMCFYSYSLVGTLASAVSFAFPVPTYQQQVSRDKTFKALCLVRGDPHLILLALTVFWIGIVFSTVQNFLFWHMKDHGSGELVMGFSVAVSVLGEILFYPFRPSLLRKLSRVGVVALGLGCLATQLLYYSFLWSWWCVLPVQILGAFSSGALWWAVGTSIQDLVTPSMERSLSHVFQSHFHRGGCSLGSFAGGFVVTRFSLAVLFRACGVALLLWLALFLCIQPRLPRERKINYSKLLTMDGSDTSESEQGSERDWLVKAMKKEQEDRKG